VGKSSELTEQNTMAAAKPRWGGAPSEKCRKCDKTVYAAEMAKMEGQIWHIECLRCVEPGCNKKLAGSNWGGFVPPDNKPYCKIHHKRLLQAAGSAVEFSGSTTDSKWQIKINTDGQSATPTGDAPSSEEHHHAEGEEHHEGEHHEGEHAHAEGGEAPSGDAPAPTKTSGSRFGSVPTDKCRKCGKTVYPAEMAKMEGQIWHIDCLKCVECNKKLSGSNWGGFVPPDNKPYCNVHHKRLLQAAGSAVEFSGSTTDSKWAINTKTEGASITPTTEGGAAGTSSSPAKPRWGGAPSEKCVKCGKTVYSAEMVKMEGQIYHSECLRCVEPGCNKKLSGANWGAFVPPDNKAYCKIHLNRLISSTGSAIGFSTSTSDSKWTISKD